MATKFLKYKNGQIAYDATGEGPLVVCVPSLGDVRGEYKIIEGAGHYPHAEMPEVTAPLIIDFLNSLKG